MLNYDAVLNHDFPPIEQTYGFRDAILYALAVGLSRDPLDRNELRFTYETGLRMVPTFPVVLCRPAPWYKKPELGIDWVRMLHGEQALQLHRPLPSACTVIGRNRVSQIIDKGEGKGALLYLERELFDRDSAQHLATATQTLVLRGNGGFGGPAVAAPKPHVMPERRPDHVADCVVELRAALLYRLCGDDNPIHVDPDLAVKAGFRKPIFHGLGTFGMVAVELLRHVLGFDPDRLKSIAARFSAPVYPGETLRTEIWVDGDVVSFRSSVVDREVTALDGGRAVVGSA